MYWRVHSDMQTARKEKNEVNKSILSLLYSELNKKAIELRVEELTDADSTNVIKKFAKQLDEEIESNVKVGRTEKANELTYQKNFHHLSMHLERMQGLCRIFLLLLLRLQSIFDVFYL